ncbi:hypothetical protein BDD12DRAFT_876580 [Trichophaea hybrida]|nr:hypothetical protein BDD12DRAFT_876580 [Trichophaea hybrida]
MDTESILGCRGHGDNPKVVLEVDTQGFQITQWGTQEGLLNSIAGNKAALQSFIRDSDAEIKQEVVNIMRDKSFWAYLDDLLVLVRGISESLKISESGPADITKTQGT